MKNKINLIQGENTDGIIKMEEIKSSRKMIKDNIFFETKKYLTKNQKVYKVLEYAHNCEEHNKISFILPLKQTTGKFILFIILNISTIGFINLFTAWFPKLMLYIYYSPTSLKLATHLGVFSKDKNLTVVNKKIIIFPKINNDNPYNIIKKFKLNINYSEKSCIMFEYKLFDYIFSTTTDNFETLNYQIKEKQTKIIEEYSTGINSNEISLMRLLFGFCDIDIKIPSIGHILLEELTDPFYLFELYSFFLWFYSGYNYYSTIIVTITIITILMSINETFSNLLKLQEISRYSCPVKVYRKNENNEYIDPIIINSTKLVPGDLYEIPNEGYILPCDTILIGGSVVVNESMLTGESNPVIKVRMTDTDEIFDTKKSESDKYLLFAGTKIVQKKKIGNSDALGIVYSTGFKTFKGNLISAIINPKEEDDAFTRDSFKYIIFMGILCIVGFAITIKFLIIDAELSNVEILIRFLDLFTTAVPPSLPACLSIGITYSLSRLKKKGIFCIKRDGVNKAGNVNIIVFDKTGTLTEDHLGISGYVSVKINENQNFEFNNFIENCENYSKIIIEHFKKKKNENNYKNKNNDLLQNYIECLACCHCLTYVNGKLVGDPIDVKMFESVDWIMKENENRESNENSDPLILDYIRPKTEENMVVRIQGNSNKNILNIKSRYEIGIVRRFDFSSKLQRMSTISKNLNEDYFKVFCKGSPEKVKELCKPQTIPQNFDKILNSYTRKGYRVLGMAFKELIMDFQQSQSVARDFAESNMIFLGLLIVKNKLKKATKSSISKYDAADIRMVMATGDNILTAISVAKECNLIPKNQEIYSLEFIKDFSGHETIKWKKINEFNNHHEIVKTDENLEYSNKIIDGNRNVSSREYSLNELYPPEKTKKLNNSEKCFNKQNSIVRLRRLSKNLKINLIEDDELNEENNCITFSNISRITAPSVIDNSLFNVDDEELKVRTDDNFCVSMTGNTFEKLYSINKKYMSVRSTLYQAVHDCFRIVLKNGRVFARMIPEHKALLVEAFKKEGLTVLMCGDGANDCSALKRAHVGISLSAEEASIAVNFTSKTPDISCIFELLREGKCSLTISIQTFKYMMLYSIIQFICITLMSINMTYLTDFQFLVSDLFIIIPLEWFLAMTHPYEELTYHYPISDLLSFPVLSSIIIQTIIVLICQLSGIKILKHYFGWKNICDSNDDDIPTPCHENTILFLVSHYQYIIMALAFSVSKPFRQSLYKNLLLMIYLLIILSYSIWITINCDDWSKDLFNLYDLKKSRENNDSNTSEKEILINGGDKIKYYLLIIIIICCIIHIFIEWVMMKQIKNYYEKKLINKYRTEILKEKNSTFNQEISSNLKIDNEISVYKYQRVYYDDRRKITKKEKNDNRIDNNFEITISNNTNPFFETI